MHFRNELMKLSAKAEQLVDRNGEKSKFTVLKEEVLKVLKLVYGETSREFRLVLLTTSPATINKVLNHITARKDVANFATA